MWLGFNLLFIAVHVTIGCIHKMEHKTQITGQIGGSVLLTCHCTDLNTKPKTFRLIKYTSSGEWEHVKIDNQKVQQLDTGAPGNLSILVSDITEDDARLYRCEMDNSYRDIKLTVNGTRPSISRAVNTNSMYFFVSIPLLLLLLLIGGIMYWRHRAKRRGQTRSSESQTNETKQQDKPVNTQSHADKTDDVMYSIIVHNNETPRSKVTKTEEKTEYASIKLD